MIYGLGIINHTVVLTKDFIRDKKKILQDLSCYKLLGRLNRQILQLFGIILLTC